MIEHELNARPLEYSEVGKKFIVHPEFHRLVSTNNSIIVGPRGSGKTTMLKVLTPEAIKYWEPKTKEELMIKENLSFLGLFVPLSKIFQDDLETRFKQSKLPDFQKNNLLFKIYFFNIIESIIELTFFLFKERGEDRKKEQEIAESLKNALGINVEYCYRISTLITAISQIKLQARRDLTSLNYNEKINYFGEVLSSIEPILRTVNDLFDFKPNQKYAICLDELDVYASPFTAEMVKSLRGGSPNIILKLTLAPIHDVNISEFLDPPQLLHDYERIYLWPTSIEHDETPAKNETSKNFVKKKYLEFAEELASQTIYEILGKKVQLDGLLGDFSYLEVFKHLKQSESEASFFRNLELPSNEDGLTNLIFQELEKRDSRFSKFLQSKLKTDSLKIENVSRRDSSTSIRKLKEIVFNRVINTRVVNGKTIFIRDVKIQYHGKQLLLKSIDGNPRYLKKLMEYLSEHVDFDNDAVKRIPINVQAKCLYKVKDLLLQRIDAIPVDSIDARLSTGLVIRQIGKFLSERLNINSDWNSSNFPSYISIPNIREIKGYEDTFRKAINNGALMIVGEVDLAKLNSVKFKELRLNYLLHLEFRLPIRKYYPISFEKILKIVPNSTTPLF